MALEHVEIRAGSLVVDDVDRVEALCQRRLVDLATLVDGVALGDHGQMVFAQCRERVLHAVEQLDGVLGHLLGPVDQALNAGGVDAVPGDRQRRLDHRQRGALHAVAEPCDVRVLDLGERSACGGLRFVEVREERGHDLAVQVVARHEVVFAVPQGVVGVEADPTDHHRWSTSPPRA